MAPVSGCEVAIEELPMPDLDQIKQGKQETRDRRGGFVKRRSGNPANRLRGCRDHLARLDRRGAGGRAENLAAARLPRPGRSSRRWQ
jgi:hypothetical protein